MPTINIFGKARYSQFCVGRLVQACLIVVFLRYLVVGSAHPTLAR
jgi:hypothetical protein